MTSTSFRQCAALANFTEFGDGILETILNPFYKTDADGNADPNWDNLRYLPHQTQGLTSLKKIMEGWSWPSSYSRSTPNYYPDDTSTGYSEETQGIGITSGEVLGITQNIPAPRIYAIKASANLDGQYVSAFRTMSPFDLSPFHLGSVGVIGNEVFAPLEYDTAGADNRVVSFLLAESSQYPFVTVSAPYRAGIVEKNEEPNQRALSCVIACSTTQLLLCGRFDADLESEYRFRVYDATSLTTSSAGSFTEKWTHLGYLTIYDENGNSIASDYTRVQGGTYTENGHLYVANDRELADDGGVHGYDMTSGRRMVSIPEDYSNGSADFEIQDVVVIDTSDVTVHGFSGQIHIWCLDNFQVPPNFTGEVTFAHWKVPTGEEDLI